VLILENLEIKRLKKDDCESLLEFLNRVFTAHNGCEMDFKSMFPRIFKKDDKKMSWHLGAKLDGELCGVIASYPLVWKVGGESLNISASGNIAVDECVRGKGIMGTLLKQIETEDRAAGFDISYLHGDRFRYGNYGFEKCGVEYIFDMTRSMLSTVDLNEELSFVNVTLQDKNFLKALYDFYNTQKSYLLRDFDDFLDALTAKKKTPVAVLSKCGDIVGYFCINDANEINEIYLEEPMTLAEIIKGYMLKNDIKEISISMAGFSPLINQALRWCGRYKIIQPGNFKVLNFKRVVESFMREKCEYEYLPDGELTIDSDIFGTWEIKKQGKEISVNPFEGKAQIYLPGNSAYQFIFGPSAPICKSGDESDVLAKMWFPLPLFCPYLT